MLSVLMPLVTTTPPSTIISLHQKLDLVLANSTEQKATIDELQRDYRITGYPSPLSSALPFASPCVHKDMTISDPQLALHQKLDMILAGNLEQVAAINSLRKENEVLKTELDRMNMEVQNLAEASF